MNTAYERTVQKDEWLTPPHVFRSLGEIDLDPCSPVNRPWDTASQHLTIHDDGLTAEWPKSAFVFCNPPYGTQTKLWLAKMKEHGNGIALVFSRTGTRMFHENVFTASAIFFFKGRLSFHDVSGKKGGTAGADSVLVAYGAEAVQRLKDCGLPGHLIILKEQ